MNGIHRQEAERLSTRDYWIVIRLDETTDGDPAYLAYSPELKGCIGQGETPELARQDLLDARVDYIEALLIDGMEVPGPMDIAGYRIERYPVVQELSGTAVVSDNPDELELRDKPDQGYHIIDVSHLADAS